MHEEQHPLSFWYLPACFCNECTTLSKIHHARL